MGGSLGGIPGDRRSERVHGRRRAVRSSAGYAVRDKDWLQQQNIDTSDDLELVGLINDISDRIHYEAGREFKPVSAGESTRTFEVDTWARCVYVGDMATSTASSPVASLCAGLANEHLQRPQADVTASPMSREAWQPIRKLEFRQNVPMLWPGMRVAVQGTWGFPAVPGNIRRAALTAIAVALDRDVEHYSTEWERRLHGEGGNVILAPRPMIISLPPAVFSVVMSYRLPLGV